MLWVRAFLGFALGLKVIRTRSADISRTGRLNSGAQADGCKLRIICNTQNTILVPRMRLASNRKRIDEFYVWRRRCGP